MIESKIRTHCNDNGELYYSKQTESGETIYSFSETFEDTWDQFDEDLYGFLNEVGVHLQNPNN